MDELFDLYRQENELNDKIEAYSMGEDELTDEEISDIQNELDEIQEKIIYLQDEEDFGEGW